MQYAPVIKTGAPRAVLSELGRKIAAIPKGFNAHRVVTRVFAERAAAIEKGAGVDWGFAEALAIGCTLKDSMSVRLSGQDVSRGSFCHRHAVIYDQKSGAPFSPLSTVVPNAARLLQVTNSPLAETAEMGACAHAGVRARRMRDAAGCAGFELGYTYESPKQLVLWEAQFGDFVNSAQMIIDNFLSCGA